MADLCVLRLFQVDEHGTCCHGGCLQMLHAEALEVLDVKMLQEFLTSRSVVECPVVEFEDKILCPVESHEALLASALHEHFLGRETAEEFVDSFRRSLGKQKFARRNVEQREPNGSFSEMHGSQEVVFAACQDVVGNGHAWRNEFGNAALDEFLSKLGVFQLVANRHAVARTHQSGQVRVEGMVGKTRHFSLRSRRTLAVISTRQGDAEHLSGNHGIITVCFIEVTATKQQYGIRMFCLQVVKLFHHWG